MTNFNELLTRLRGQFANLNGMLSEEGSGNSTAQLRNRIRVDIDNLGKSIQEATRSLDRAGRSHPRYDPIMHELSGMRTNLNRIVQGRRSRVSTNTGVYASAYDSRKDNAHMSDRQLIDSTMDVMDDQDKFIEQHLAAGVATLDNIAHTMSDEFDKHGQIIDNIDRKQTSLTHRTADATFDIDKIRKMSKSCCISCLIFVLICTVIYLLLKVFKIL
ncbi:hypothetical protein PCE1_001410 [Barthelona sp. PCE]